MDEYELSPDELIAKAFRVIQSGRAAYGKMETVDHAVGHYKCGN
jgi:hypothetical protein